MTINAAAEISAAATVIQFWNSSVNPAVWITVFLVFIVVINFCGVRLYGEVLYIDHRFTLVQDPLIFYSPKSYSPRSKSC
jgi:amino acid permease